MKKGVISAVSMVAGVMAGAAAAGKIEADRVIKVQNMSDKHLALFLLMSRWVKVKQEGKNLELYFKSNGYKKIAIYGMSFAGKALVDELRNTEIEVAYGIDKKSDSIYADIDIVSVDDFLDKVDVVVVTAITYFNEIEEMLSLRVDCPVVSLENILYGM